MLKIKQNQTSLNNQTSSETTDVNRSDLLDAENEQHSRSRSLASLQSMFTRRKRPALQRSISQSSTQSTRAPSSCTSSSSSSIIPSTSNKESTLSKILRLFPLKGNKKSTLSLANTSALPSQKSLEFEALLEEYPSRTIKTSLTPCTAD